VRAFADGFVALLMPVYLVGLGFNAFAVGAIARRIGLINTMVFTHLPSNLFLILVPFAPNLAVAIGLLLARSALSQMDVPTRSSYVMAVVRPEERPAAASVTAVPRTFAWATGSIMSGYLMSLSGFGWPLVTGGVIKGVYDVLLLLRFRSVRPPEEATPQGRR
jgi:predicted MFS family arabinose efflux permease